MTLPAANPPQPPPPKDRKTLPSRPDGEPTWVQGDWAFDPEKDEAWEDPKTWRRLIGTPEELEAVADAILHEYEITDTDPEGKVRVIVGSVGDPMEVGDHKHGVGKYAAVENLRDLIQEVQVHPDVRLAEVETEESANEQLVVTRRWITDIYGTELPNETEPNEIRLWHCAVLRMQGDAASRPTEIGCKLTLTARFASAPQFGWARFAARVRFDGAHIAAHANFYAAWFAAEVWFDGVRFASHASFTDARFVSRARFVRAEFADHACFWNARFADRADFKGARFGGHTTFGHARFAAHADLSLVRFATHADFGRVSFARDASFGSARFSAHVSFHHARFAEDVDFRHTRFAAGPKLVTALAARELAKPRGDRNGTRLQYCKNYPDGLMSFANTEFTGDADFSGARVWKDTAIEFVGARFARRVRFDDPGVRDTPVRRRPRRLPMIRGSIFFTDATMDERMTFIGTRFGERARLGFDNFLARSGATVELTAEQLRIPHTAPPGTPARYLAQRARDWLFFDPTRTLMAGGDSDTPAEIERAADDYELLAANYARQPATDAEEDGCRWMAHELRRRAKWIRAWEPLARPLSKPLRAQRPAPKHVPAWLWDTLDLLARPLEMVGRTLVNPRRSLRATVKWLMTCTEHVIIRWLVMRTAVGYLLQWQRIMITGAAIMLVCAVVYGFGASENTIWHGAEDKLPSGPVERAAFGLFFSLTTFVTLGYGDYGPKSDLFKTITGIEALLGVTLLALFTVAWGRKMVR